MKADLCITPSHMQRIKNTAAKFKVDDVPKDLQLLLDHMMDWLAETDNKNDILPLPAKKKQGGVVGVTVW